ncbi:MAG: ABC-F family ATP-binding cassette domain-containing protein [Chloroflexi bacterium]|nr:ABC-F family ATP-binding cassette domain-containing protein [Chloroflexota bacterium]
MIICKLDHVAHQYVTQPVLRDVTWEIHTGHKIGLVGANGAGKSTLLRLIAGELAPESGAIYRQKDQRIGYLAQEPALDPQRTVWQEALGGAAEVVAAEAELRRLEGRMADPAVAADEAALARVMAAYDRAHHAFEQVGGYAAESRVRGILASLGLRPDQLDQPVGQLSGGQRKLVGLAKLLAADANFLLLDEPDNHLDLEAKADLERLIAEFPGTVVIVSHDRYLLDGCVTHIAEVEDGKLTSFAGDYSAYAVDKQLRLLRQQQMYEAQQKEIARIEAAIARFEYWASVVVNERHAKQARSRRKMLDRMERIEQPTLERRRMDLDLGGWRGSHKVLEIVGLGKAFADEGGDARVVLDGLDLLIWHGERVGLLGPNGAGKTVLLRCILGQEEPTAGEVRVGPSVEIGHYAQQHETLDLDHTLIEEVRLVKPMYESQAAAFLGRFLFPYEMTRKRVRELSGGERNRLQLAKLMLRDTNFLLLDEPTNNLDLPSCEVLEGALDDYQGTVLVVSHDRYFLDRVVDRIVELDGGRLTEYPGDYTYYAGKKAARK